MSGPLRTTIVIIVALLVPIVPYVIIGELPGEQWLSNAGSDAFLFGATGAALLVADVLLPIPSSIVGTLLAGRLGFITGFLWTWSGLCAGHLLGYAVGRYLLSAARAHLPETPTLLAVLMSRPLPILAEALTLTAGATQMPFTGFVGACVIGNFVYAFLLAANGAALIPAGLVGPVLFIPMLLPAVGLWLWWRHRSGLASIEDGRPGESGELSE